MSYEVTATRTRPKGFDQLVGQEFVVATLRSALSTKRIAPAYLFSGPRGCGKTSAARILAKALNCKDGPTPEPCGTCSNCVEIARSASLDVIEIDGASNTSVDNIRQIKDEILFSPNSGKYKVYIIDEVHMLSNSAFNALLKTVEEPPPYVVFIFATTELHKVPATIKSRCQQFSFRPITTDIIKAMLAKAASDANIKAEGEALFWIAKEATGSLRDAYTLFDQVASFSGDSITMARIREELGIVGLDSINALVEACAAGESAKAIELADAAMVGGTSVEQLVSDLIEYFRSLLIVKSGITRESIIGFPPERLSKAALDAFLPEQIEMGLGLLFDLYRNLRASARQRFELDLALSRLCWLTQYIAPRELLREIRAFKKQIGLGGEVPNRPFENSQRPGIAAVVKPGIVVKPESSERADLADLDEPPIEDEPNPPSSLQSPLSRPPSPSSNAVATAAKTADALSEGADPGLLADPFKLRARFIASIKTAKPMLATNLEKASSWIIEGESLLIPMQEAYQISFVRPEQPFIGKKINELTGKFMRIEIVLESSLAEGAGETNESASRESQKTDEGVELVKRMFKGTVIAEGGKNGN